MNREEFNQLDIKGQVDYFNNELKLMSNNFNAICRQIGISKNTILNRFKSNGFELLRTGQKIIGFSQYIANDRNIEKDLILQKDWCLNEQNCSVEIEKRTAKNFAVAQNDSDLDKNIKAENSAMKNKKKASDPYEINLILKRIESLEKKVEILESANLHSAKYLESQDLDYNKNFIKSYENTITKTFKIDLEVYKELERVFNRYKIYKKQDIVSSLLKYALDNIK
ncbi:hypothetical protein [Terrisporobacter sp.]|uniref:hypothetical protein n=1 Tax=Terrisporobacter sp. TaxID=1965305 RepID=UPI002608E40F|nr:hypothetical protein [Terrisporobacter sp.]